MSWLLTNLPQLADSIFWDDASSILFASFKYVGYDYTGDMEKMADNPKVREWWKMTDEMQEVRPPRAATSVVHAANMCSRAWSRARRAAKPASRRGGRDSRRSSTTPDFCEGAIWSNRAVA